MLAPPSQGAVPQRPAELHVVQSNVGNINVPGCGEQVYKLCLRPVEERAAGELRAFRPDLVAFQEILPPDLCERAPSTNPNNLCSAPLDPPSQVARLLGEGYAEACDDRFGWDCLAMRGARRIALDTRPVQSECNDTGFTLATGTIRVRGWPIAVGNAHPSSTDAPCRAAQLRDFFGALPARGPVLVLGDFNVDPFRESDESVEEWERWVPSRFRHVSGDELTLFPCGSSQLDATGETLDGPLRPCTGPLRSRAIDHVLARGATGSCEVRRVDGGGGMDHRAQDCRIALARHATPRVRLRARGCRVRAIFRPRPPHLDAVRFRVGKRVRVDRRPPYTVRRRGGERRVRAKPLLATGAGPVSQRRLRRC